MVCAHARMRSRWREGKGHPHMTSLLREDSIGPNADKSTDRLRECDSDKRGGMSIIMKILRASYVNGPEGEGEGGRLKR